MCPAALPIQSDRGYIAYIQPSQVDYQKLYIKAGDGSCITQLLAKCGKISSNAFRLDQLQTDRYRKTLLFPGELDQLQAEGGVGGNMLQSATVLTAWRSCSDRVTSGDGHEGLFFITGAASASCLANACFKA